MALDVTEITTGDTKVYVTFRRVDDSTVDHYNIYVDTNATTAASKSSASGTVTQPSSGDSVDIVISGLTNGTTYFIGVEAVTSAGALVGTRATTLTSGGVLQIAPQETIGPAEQSGEGGCTLIPGTRAQF